MFVFRSALSALSRITCFDFFPEQTRLTEKEAELVPAFFPVVGWLLSFAVFFPLSFAISKNPMLMFQSHLLAALAVSSFALLSRGRNLDAFLIFCKRPSSRSIPCGFETGVDRNGFFSVALILLLIVKTSALSSLIEIGVLTECLAVPVFARGIQAVLFRYSGTENVPGASVNAAFFAVGFCLPALFVAETSGVVLSAMIIAGALVKVRADECGGVTETAAGAAAAFSETVGFVVLSLYTASA